MIVFLTIITSIRITEQCRSFVSKAPLDPEEIHTETGPFSPSGLDGMAETW